MTQTSGQEEAVDWRADRFFALGEFAHADLFEGDVPVWAAIGEIRTYLLKHLRPGIHPSARVHPGAYLVGDNIQIGEECVIEPGAYIQGPIILGRGCLVRHGAYLRGDIIAGEECLLGHASEVKNAVLLNGAKAPHFNYVGDSLLGARVNMGAGSKLSNLKMVPGNVTIFVGGGKIDSGLRKFGAVMGDDVEIGCNAVLNPGTVLGPRSMVYSNLSVRGYYDSDTILKLRQETEVAERRA